MGQKIIHNVDGRFDIPIELEDVEFAIMLMEDGNSKGDVARYFYKERPPLVAVSIAAEAEKQFKEMYK